MRPRSLLAASLLLLAGCTCAPAPLQRVQPAKLTADPSPLVLPRAWVGQTTRAIVQVTNVGEAAATVEVSLDAPFETATAQLRLVRADVEQVEVAVTPTRSGRLVGVLRLGELLEVPVEVDADAVPACFPSVCETSAFDVSAGVCVTSRAPDATSSETSCVTGQCLGGSCVGVLKGCDDGDACSVDACSETLGCSHEPRVCPQPSAPCHHSHRRAWATPWPGTRRANAPFSSEAGVARSSSPTPGSGMARPGRSA